MISFDAAHRAVHFPPDRRFRIWIRPPILIGIAIAIACNCSRLDRGRSSRNASCSGRSTDIPKQLRGATWLSRMGTLLPLLQFPVRDDADSKRTFYPDGPPSSLFQ